MEENFIYLTYYQAMALVMRVDDIIRNNPDFNDERAKSFQKYVFMRTGEIMTTYPKIKLKLFPNASKYKISKDLFDYLTRLTSIDVYDKKTIQKYTIIIKELETKSFQAAKYRLEKSKNNNGRTK